MKELRSVLGRYVWNVRSGMGMRRRKLARIIGCEQAELQLLEERGEAADATLVKVIGHLRLDTLEVFWCEVQDKQNTLAWVAQCGEQRTPMIVATHSPFCYPVEIPSDVVASGNDAIEDFAKAFARKWNQTVELHVRHHIRLMISPSGEMEIQELGRFDDWLEVEK